MISDVLKSDSGILSRIRGSKSNTTLTSLNLSGIKTDVKRRLNIIYSRKQIIGTDNQIGEEGTRMMSEALKSNSSLTKLNLDSNEK